MYYILKTNKVDPSMIEAYTKENLLAFVVHEDVIDDKNIEYFLEEHGECEIKVEIAD